MHHLVIFPVGLFALGGMILIMYRRQLVLVLHDFLSATDDLWSWTTQDGLTFESVVPEAIDGEDVIFVHRFGRTRLSISQLSDASRQSLFRSGIWLSHTAHAPTEKKLKAA